MQFTLVDRIIEVIPGQRIVAIKAVTRSEEYLADHFPSFPVLPGVLMLESFTEAARWLVWLSQDFVSSMILLREAKNVIYKSFVGPGQTLRTEITCRRLDRGESEFVGIGFCDSRQVVKARFALTHWNLADTNPELAQTDRRLLAQARAQWALLDGTGAGDSA